MYIPPHFQWLEARQGPPGDASSGPNSQDSPDPGNKDPGKNGNNNSGGTSARTNAAIIVAAVTVFAITVGVILFFILRTLRRMNCSPKYIPGKRLKDRWNRWNAGRSYGQLSNGSSSNQANDTAYNGSGRSGGSEMNTTENATNGVRRETSVRSVITLPPYSAAPKPEEQIIAREGEREGMDVVVEFPETAEEEEARREELMEGLYQIRVQRRQEHAEREARRQARREARQRGDFIRLEELRLQNTIRDRSRSEARGNRGNSNSRNQSATTLLAESQSRGRDRRIASVSYAALGRVRHDGSRLRNNSTDSDNRPLLQSSRDGSTGELTHYRGESYSSLVSGSSVTSDGDTLTPVVSQRQSMHSARSRSNSRPESIPEEEPDTAGVDATGAPPPPEYDFLDWGEAPAYSSPVVTQFGPDARGSRNLTGEARQTTGSNENERREERDETAQSNQNNETDQSTERSRPPQLPQLSLLPTIQVDIASPIGDLTPTTPTMPRPREEQAEHAEHPAENPAEHPAHPAEHSSNNASDTTTAASHQNS